MECFRALASALGGLFFGENLFVVSRAKDLIVAPFAISPLMEGWFVGLAMVGAVAVNPGTGRITASDESARFHR